MAKYRRGKSRKRSKQHGVMARKAWRWHQRAAAIKIGWRLSGRKMRRSTILAGAGSGISQKQRSGVMAAARGAARRKT